jgi:hypothetical protein
MQSPRRLDISESGNDSSRQRLLCGKRHARSLETQKASQAPLLLQLTWAKYVTVPPSAGDVAVK